MSFIDNPVISSLGNALGMGGLFAEMGGAGASPDPAEAPTPKPGASKPNIPEYRNRPYIPRPENGGGVTPGVAGGGNPITPGEMSPETLQDPKVQSLLGQYGVHPSQTPPDPNLFIHNPDAWAKHPVLSGLLERGLGGLAYAHEGNNFLQSLTGGVKGMQEYEAARGAQVNSQLMAPLLQAHQVADLQHQSDLHNAALDEIKYHEGQLANQKLTAGSKAARLAAIAPRPNKSTGGMMTLQGDIDDPSTLHWEDAPELGQDEELANKNSYFHNATAAAIAANRAAGKPDNLTDDQRITIANHWTEQQSVAKSAGSRSVVDERSTHPVPHTGRAAADRPGYLSATQKSQLSDLDKQEKEITKQIDLSGQMGPPLIGDSGEVIGSTKDKAAYRTKKQVQLNEVRRQKDVIRGTTPQQAAPPPNQNPMTVTPPGSNPYRH